MGFDGLDFDFVRMHFVERAVFCPALRARNAFDMYRELVSHLYAADDLSYDTRQIIANAFMERERTLTSYVGNGVAIPHIVRTEGMLAGDRIGWFRCPDGIETLLKRRQRIRLVLCVVGGDRLQSLCGIGLEMLNSPELREGLTKAETADEMKRCVTQRIWRLCSQSGSESR
jgi:mannitol/fructose-specific phosphotransferase system IIA component